MNLKLTVTIFVFTLLNVLFATGVSAQTNDIQKSLEENKNISSYVEMARDTEKDAHIKAIAHSLSAEDHREKNVALGIVAALASAAVSVITLFGLASKSGLDNDTISVSSLKGWAWAIILVSFLSTALTSIQMFLDNAGDAARHKISSDNYNSIQQEIETFLADSNSGVIKGENQISEAWKDILKEWKNIEKDSPILTSKATKSAIDQIKASK